MKRRFVLTVSALLAVFMFGFVSCQLEDAPEFQTGLESAAKAVQPNDAAVQAWPTDLVGTIWQGITPRGYTATLTFKTDTVDVDYGDGTSATYDYVYNPNTFKGEVYSEIGTFTVDPRATPAEMDFDDWWGHGVPTIFYKTN